VNRYLRNLGAGILILSAEGIMWFCSATILLTFDKFPPLSPSYAPTTPGSLILSLSSSLSTLLCLSSPLPLPLPNPKPNLPWIFQIHIVARKISIVRYKTRHKKRPDRTRYQLHTKTQDMLLNNLDFKNPVCVWLGLRLG
jgi:hypothetical protein